MDSIDRDAVAPTELVSGWRRAINGELLIDQDIHTNGQCERRVQDLRGRDCALWWCRCCDVVEDVDRTERAVVVELRADCYCLAGGDADRRADDGHADFLDIGHRPCRDVDVLLVHVVERIFLRDGEDRHDADFETNGIIVERFGIADDGVIA